MWRVHLLVGCTISLISCALDLSDVIGVGEKMSVKDLRIDKVKIKVRTY